MTFTINNVANDIIYGLVEDNETPPAKDDESNAATELSINPSPIICRKHCNTIIYNTQFLPTLLSIPFSISS